MAARRRVTIALGALAWFAAAPFVCHLASGVAGEQPEERIVVTMHARQFDPSLIVLHAGRPTHLVLHNEDAELHAFVPDGLFAGVSLHVGGNGAPEFDEQGFKKVIIPSGGRADFRFTPERPGDYPFLCDMPGHEMRGTIRVE